MAKSKCYFNQIQNLHVFGLCKKTELDYPERTWHFYFMVFPFVNPIYSMWSLLKPLTGIDLAPSATFRKTKP